MTLDDSQRRFCDAPAGNIRLLAPAGCGKTHSLLHRCRALNEQSPGKATRFLVVTFTVAARDELKSRMAEQPEFAGVRDSVEITTLNAWGYRRIKSQAKNPRLLTRKEEKHFAVMNQLQPIWSGHKSVKMAIEGARNPPTAEILQLIDDFKSLGFDHKRYRTFDEFIVHLARLSKENLDWRMADITDRLMKIGVLAPSRRSDGNDSTPRRLYDAFYRFWLDATKHLISSATFTFEDQKYFAYLDERQKGQDADKPLTGAARYDHVIVDEFQDINPLDLNLTRAIVERHRATITIVGDDDQAIFEWRGTTPSYILNPEQYFKGDFETFTLGVNYRSPANIVERSQRLIRHNVNRVEKQTRAHNPANAEIHIVPTNSIDESLNLAYQLVEDHVLKGSSPTRIALVGRKKAQLIPYQVYFASKNISFCAAEDLQIFLSKAFDRLLELVDIKQKATTRMRSYQIVDDLVKLCQFVKRWPLSRTDKSALENYLTSTAKSTMIESVESVAGYGGPLKGANSDRRMSGAYAQALRAFLNAETVHESLMALGDHFEGLQADFGKGADDIFYKDPPFGQLAEYARRYGDDYNQFLDDIERAKAQLAHVPPTDDDATSTTDIQRRPLHLMTALRAKGKEFQTVMLLDCIEDIWPMKYAQTPAQLEAERRVFYVAFTRAQSRVVFQICHRVGKSVATPSRYLGELGFTPEQLAGGVVSD